MKIKQLTIQNYKSIKELKIVDPAPFSAFIGANGVGKSNIFEAVEFLAIAWNVRRDTAIELFGGWDTISNKKLKRNYSIEISLDTYPAPSEDILTSVGVGYGMRFLKPGSNLLHESHSETSNKVAEVNEDPTGYFSKTALGFDSSRIFVGQIDKVKLNIDSSHQLKLDGSNLEKVLKRLLLIESIKDEMFEWLSLFIPEFEKLEVYSDNISGRDTLQLTMKGYKDPFGRNLISDGTYNILCLLTAVYQSDKPQFLCIEEPENGLNPYVVRQLVQFFRSQCEEKGHYIWVNTHSQTLVSQLKASEVILVDKKDGFTEIKQLKDNDLHGLPLDEAWLTNALGGGLPW